MKWLEGNQAIILCLALVILIIYGVVIKGERDHLNIELKMADAVLTLTQHSLDLVEKDLASTKSELGSMKQTLASIKTELDLTKHNLTSKQEELKKMEVSLSLYRETLGVMVTTDVKNLKEPVGGEVKLSDKTGAVNPTWQQLREFVLADYTDQRTWMANIFDCSQFSEMLHNNAEAQGIRAAYVTLKFQGKEVGHALTAFKTTDRGLVYVEPQMDSIAYVTKGKEYGIIDFGQDTPLDYAYYEKVKADWDFYGQKLEAYNSEVERFNREIYGKVFYTGTAEWEQIKEWQRALGEEERALASLRNQLPTMEQPEDTTGIVESIEVFW